MPPHLVWSLQSTIQSCLLKRVQTHTYISRNNDKGNNQVDSGKPSTESEVYKLELGVSYNKDSNLTYVWQLFFQTSWPRKWAILELELDRRKRYQNVEIQVAQRDLQCCGQF